MTANTFIKVTQLSRQGDVQGNNYTVSAKPLAIRISDIQALTEVEFEKNTAPTEISLYNCELYSPVVTENIDEIMKLMKESE